MPTNTPPALLQVRYYHAAQEYLRNLTLENIMEATPQATQRKITLESLDLVHAKRPDVQVFNELLVQYPLPRQTKPGQVVPDNMIVVHSEPIEAEGSFDTPFQPVGPYCVLEYVSKSNKRKDYEDNMRKYEQELKVPYYLLFFPDHQELTLYRRNKRGRYVAVPPDEDGRCEIPDLHLAVGLLDGWVRYWYQGELLPLPADLQRELDQTKQELAKMTQRADAEAQRADAEQQARLRAEQELAQLRAEMERLRQQQKE